MISQAQLSGDPIVNQKSSIINSPLCLCASVVQLRLLSALARKHRDLRFMIFT
jgi:hypothetical protein